MQGRRMTGLAQDEGYKSTLKSQLTPALPYPWQTHRDQGHQDDHPGQNTTAGAAGRSWGRQKTYWERSQLQSSATSQTR